jgi:endoglucanase
MAYKRFLQASKILFGVFALQLFSLCLLADTKTQPATPVSKYGQLKIIGTHLCDTKGNQIQLKGMSTGGLQWYGDIVNEAAFTAIAKDWNCEVIRLALYVGEGGFHDRPSLKELVIKGIDLAIKLGIYVIVDWHVLTPGDPNYSVYSGAKAFFTEIAKLYGAKPNIIYEIMNEPNGDVDWAKDLKPYATGMVSTIRAIDPDNLILIGSGTWSQDVDIAAANPVAGSNLMYTVHFYAGTHGASLRAKIVQAIAKGAAVFCSE